MRNRLRWPRGSYTFHLTLWWVKKHSSGENHLPESGVKCFYSGALYLFASWGDNKHDFHLLSWSIFRNWFLSGYVGYWISEVSQLRIRNRRPVHLTQCYALLLLPNKASIRSNYSSSSTISESITGRSEGETHIFPTTVHFIWVNCEAKWTVWLLP